MDLHRAKRGPGALAEGEGRGAEGRDEAIAGRVGYLIVARRLVASGHRAIGFFAADGGLAGGGTKRIDTRALALRLGAALVDVGGDAVSIVEPDGARGGDAGEGVESEPAGPPGAEGPALIEHVLGPLLSLIVPSTARLAAAHEVRARIVAARARSGRLLVDLSGARDRGEHLGIASDLDGVMVVAATGRTRHDTLGRACAELPAAALLGVILVAAHR